MQTTTSILFWTIGGSLLILIAFAIFINYVLNLYNKKEIQYNRDLQLITIKKEKEILNARIEVQEETIQNISREIHDNVNQLLTLTKFNLNSLKQGREGKVDPQINLVNELLTSAIQELTNLSRALSAESVKDFGLLRALDAEVNRINSIEDTKIQLDLPSESLNIKTETQLVLYRIFQEATKNSIVHGKSSEILVSIIEINGKLKMIIEDNGQGFNLTEVIGRQNHIGLKNIKKRVSLLNGELFIDSSIGVGTKITVLIPNDKRVSSETDENEG